MSLEFVLVAGPLVRASSWEPTARHLRDAGYRVQVPDVLAHRQPPPSWSAWNSHPLEHIDPRGELILVGHSSASVLVADLSGKLPCRCVIIVDGEVPPSQGAAAPVRPALRDFIKTLAGPDGTLPIWSRWLGDARRASLVGLDILARDPKAFAAFESGLPTLSVDWLDDTIALANWDHIPAGLIQTSAIYDHSAVEAQRRGWPVTRLQGTHLHPTLNPAETAGPIIAISPQLLHAPADSSLVTRNGHGIRFSASIDRSACLPSVPPPHHVIHQQRPNIVQVGECRRLAEAVPLGEIGFIRCLTWVGPIEVRSDAQHRDPVQIHQPCRARHSLRIAVSS